MIRVLGHAERYKARCTLLIFEVSMVVNFIECFAIVE